MEQIKQFVDTIPSPSYVLEENKLRKNLSLIKMIATKADVEIILALKAFAQWRSFPIFRDYIFHTTASSLYEARLSAEEFGSFSYTYSPAYEEDSFQELLSYSSHITFNSLSQYNRFYPNILAWNRQNPQHHISVGLRINPEYSEIATDLYNPCAAGSRFGVMAEDMPLQLPEGIEGFHFHCLCENDSTTLIKVLENVEGKYGHWLPRLKWLNMGGGHLMTKKGYHVEMLIEAMRDLHARYPNLKIIMEPGSAFLWETGFLETSVVDIVTNSGIKTAILNVSFTCHMPDCLEMPYMPTVRGAEIKHLSTGSEELKDDCVYRLGGNSCLSGDFLGYWKFANPLKVGDRLIFEDMIHYTTVKTNMFNGINHPSIVMLHSDGKVELQRSFEYQDYRDRMC